jgi:hypothetical protein
MERGHIQRDRCSEIIEAADEAITECNNGGEIAQLGGAMARCCGTDEDEAAFYRCAVDVILLDKWGAPEEDRATIIGLMNVTYPMACDILREDDKLKSAGWGPDDEPQTKSDVIRRSVPTSQPKAAPPTPPKGGGCLILLGFIGILPILASAVYSLA